MVAPGGECKEEARDLVRAFANHSIPHIVAFYLPFETPLFHHHHRTIILSIPAMHLKLPQPSRMLYNVETHDLREISASHSLSSIG